jgi:nucleoside-diphosphate-sugar epimerase
VPAAFVTGGSGFIGGALVERLVRDGWTVSALARSPESAEKVRARGAEPVRGDLSDEGALTAGARGAEVVFHLAAKLGDSGAWDEFRRVNVGGTEALLRAARQAGVRRFVHVGTEAALLRGQPLVLADERTPLAFDSSAAYSATKAQAEAAVLAANGGGLETIAVRPRFVWGTGDTTLLRGMVQMVRAGRFRWIGGGRHLTDTTHVGNVVEALLLAASRGRPGAAYFVTDGEPVVFRDFVSALLRTQGVEPPRASVPLGVARAAAAAVETVWRLARREDPPLTRLTVWLAGLECTLDTTRAREELGYAPVVTRAQGLSELSGSEVHAAGS